MGARMTNHSTISEMRLPDWVPVGAQHYLAHTEQGAPIRALAREAGCHASTILRQIRKVEMRRDDPLVDAALRKLSAGDAVRVQQSIKGKNSKQTPQSTDDALTNAVPNEETLTQEAPRVLRRLCESGAVLAVAEEMEKAVVVRDTASGGTARTAIVDAALAQAMALKDWITPTNSGRVVRYHITVSGRAALAEMLKGARGAVAQASDGRNDHAGKDASIDAEWHEHAEISQESPRRQRMRYALSESPLVALARRRDQDGKPFLSDALVHAGERLREDFELAQMDSRITQNWDSFLSAGGSQGARADTGASSASLDARARVATALGHLGPGLSDVVLRCCCYLEGLETTEKRLGWSARSGKIVLRIALIRLSRHYDETIGSKGAMIG